MDFKDEVRKAQTLGKNCLDIPLDKRLDQISIEDREKLQNFVLLNITLSIEKLDHFFSLCTLRNYSPDENQSWIIQCLSKNLINIKNDDNLFYLSFESEIFQYFIASIPVDSKKLIHENAKAFILELFFEFANSINLDLPSDLEQRELFIISPNGVIDQWVHIPHTQPEQIGLLNIVIALRFHFFELEKYSQAATITNFIFLPLFRIGYQDLAKSLLFEIIISTSGLIKLTSQSNLATLLRLEKQNSEALKIYRKTIIGFIKNKSFKNLAVVFTEMASTNINIGDYLRAINLLNISIFIYFLLGVEKEKIIAQAQLASAYRSFGLPRRAYRYARKAVLGFRTIGDMANLAGCLITLGNSQMNLKMYLSALESFNEAISISSSVSDYRATSSALSGKARALMYVNELNDVHELLNESIAIRTRLNDHDIGIEYENLGHYFELKENYQSALIWYQKALEEFKTYIPTEVARTKIKIKRVEKKQIKSQKITRTILKKH